MADITVPTQIRSLDPFSEYYSDNVNKLTRLFSDGTNCINSNASIEVNRLPSDATNYYTALIVTPGSCVKDNVYIELTENFTVDFTNRYFYYTLPPFTGNGVYYLVLDYTYYKTDPAPEARIKILKPTEHHLMDNTKLFLKAVTVASSRIQSIADFDSTGPARAQRVYNILRAGYANRLVNRYSNGIPGQIRYIRDRDVSFISDSTYARELGTLEWVCNTSSQSCKLGQLVYIGANNIAYPASSASHLTLATGFVTKLGTTNGKIQLNGFIASGLLEPGDTTTAPGDILYLTDRTDSAGIGTATSRTMTSNVQIIGRCITLTGGRYNAVLSGLGSGGGQLEPVHNLLHGKQGGDGTNFYHLGYTDYVNRRTHNTMTDLQGGDATGDQYFHLTYNQWSRIATFSPYHYDLLGVQGGTHPADATARQQYHLDSTQWTNIGLHERLRDLQGGDTTSHYHLTRTDWARYGNHELLNPNSLLGGDSTGHYHLNQFAYNSLRTGLHNNIAGRDGGDTSAAWHLTPEEYEYVDERFNNRILRSTVNSLRAYVVSLINYNEDDYSLWNKNLDGPIYGNTPVGDIIAGNTIQNYGNAENQDGVFGLLAIGNYWRLSNSNLSTGRSYAASLGVSFLQGFLTGGFDSATNYVTTAEKYNKSTRSWSYFRDNSNIVPYDTTGCNGMFYMAVHGGRFSVIGGHVNGVYLQKTYGCNISTGVWWFDNSMPIVKAFGASMSIGPGPSDDSMGVKSGIMASGRDSNSCLEATYEYTWRGQQPVGIWTARTNCINARSKCSGISLNTDAGLMTGGTDRDEVTYIDISEKFLKSQNLWTLRSRLDIPRHSSGVSSLTSDFGILTCGKAAEGTLSTATSRYSDTMNLWAGKAAMPYSYRRYGIGGFGIGPEMSVFAGGTTEDISSINSSNEFIDLETLTLPQGSTCLMTNKSTEIPIHQYSKSINIYTNVLARPSDKPRVIVASALTDDSDIRVNVTLNDGTNWSSAYVTDSYIDTSDMACSDVNMRLMFTIGSNVNADTWISISGDQASIQNSGSVDISMNIGFVVCGQTALEYNNGSFTTKTGYPICNVTYEGPTAFRLNSDRSVFGYANFVYKYIRSSDGWVSVANKPYTSYFPASFPLNPYTGLSVGGSLEPNSSVMYMTSVKYIETQNVWIVRNNSITTLTKCGSATLSRDMGLVCGLHNAKYSDSANMWSTVSAPSLRLSGTETFNLDTLYAMCTGGQNADSPSDVISNSFKYSSMGNFWTGRASSDEGGRRQHTTFSIGTGEGVSCFGMTSGGTPYTGANTGRRYYDGEVKFVGFAADILEYV